MATKFNLFFVGMSLASMQFGACLQCHLCSGSSSCLDPFDASRYGVAQCVTSGRCAKETYIDGNFQVINRYCSPEPGSGCSKEDQDGSDGWWEGWWVTESRELCYCATDLCNTGGVKVTYSLLTFAVTVFLAFCTSV